MFSFAYPGLLFLLFLIPGIVFIYIISRYRRRRKMEKMGDPKTLESLMPTYSVYKAGVRLTVAMAALFGIIFALARPWGGVRSTETTREGIEIVIAVDASNSMLASATAEENGTERMKMAKLMLEKLINRLGNDRVGLIAFAGDAYTLIPVTNDYVSAKAFLNSIDPTLFTHQGTNIGAAVSLAEKSFSRKDDIGRAIILLTDAEELENQQGVLSAVAQAAKRGIQTDVIGIGNAPVTIPDSYRGRMIDSETGEVVHTALNEELAIEIADAGKGIYVNAANDEAVDELMKQLGNLKKAAMESSFLVSHDELYFPFVILAIVMIILDFVITDKKNRWLDRFSFFGDKTSKSTGSSALALALIVSGLTHSCDKKDTAENVGIEEIEMQEKTVEQTRRDSLMQVFSLEKERDYILAGNSLHETGEFERADSNYVAALGQNPRSVVASLNTGVNTVRSIMAMEMATAEGQLTDSVMEPLYKKAQSTFMNAASPKVEKGNVSSLAYYNLGNLAFTQKKYSEAIDMYKEALRLNPDDEHARRNLRIAQLQKDDNQQNQQQNRQQDQQEQQPEQDRQQLNNETSDQILEAAERKENMRRMQMNMESAPPTENSGRSQKNW